MVVYDTQYSLNPVQWHILDKWRWGLCVCIFTQYTSIHIWIVLGHQSMGYISITITLAATRVYVNWTKHVRHANQLSKYHIYFAMCHLLPVDFVMAALLRINCNTRLCMIGMPLQGYSHFMESYTYWFIRYTGRAYRTKEYDNYVVYAMLHYCNKEILLIC